MSFALKEILPPSSVTAAALITSFIEASSDVLAVARGNRLFLYTIEGDFLGEPYIVHLYGTISKVIPITYSMGSKILVILNDLSTCILTWDDDRECVRTTSQGNLMQNCMTSIPKDIKSAVVPSAIVLQLHPFILTVYPIVSYSELGKPFPVPITCKSIIDFVFIGPISKVTRLAVLTEEISDNPKLHLIEIDLTNNFWTEDPKQTISLPEDTYLILPYQPDTSSSVFCFSSLKATSVTYAAGIAPEKRTHTIFTPNMLKWYQQMHDSFYAFVDVNGSLRVTELNERAKISFVDLAKGNIPSCVVAISSSTLFIGSKKGVSHLYHVDTNSLESLIEFDATDSVLSFEENNSTYAVCESATMRLDPLQKIQEHAILSAKGLNAVWCKPGEENDTIVTSSMTKTFFLEGMDGVYEPISDSKFITDEATIYISFEPFVQVTPTTARFEGKENKGNFSNAVADESFIVLVEPKSTTVYTYDGEVANTLDCMCTAACLVHDRIVVATLDSVVFYDREFKELYKVPISSPAVSIAYDGSSYIVAHSKDTVTLISGEEKQEISCPGFHTNVQIIHNRAVVFGESPVTFVNGKRIFFGTQTLLSGYELNDEVLLVARNGIMIAQEGERSITHNSLDNEKDQIQRLKKIPDGFLMVSGHNLCFAKTLTDTRTVIYHSDERIDDLVIFDDIYVALTAHSAACFVSDSPPTFKFVYKEEFEDIASCCGVFQSMFYIVHPLVDNTFNRPIPAYVQFYCVETTGRNNIMEKFISFRVDYTIKAVATQGNFFAVGMDNGLIRVFQFNDHTSDIKEVAAHSLVMMNITSLSFIDNNLIVGTDEGVVVLLSMEFGVHKKMKIIYASRIGSGITCIKSSKLSNSVLVGTETGQVFEVFDMMFPKGFSVLYSALENRFFSEGHFNKILEHSVMIGQRILNTEKFVDVDLLIDFAKAPKEIQQKALTGFDITVDEAMQKINVVFGQIGKFM